MVVGQLLILATESSDLHAVCEDPVRLGHWEADSVGRDDEVCIASGWRTKSRFFMGFSYLCFTFLDCIRSFSQCRYKQARRIRRIPRRCVSRSAVVHLIRTYICAQCP